MARDAIKGITIEFRGDTTDLGKALSTVNKEIKSTDNALKEVDKALKLDPSNVELLAQREKLLNEEIAKTEEKLSLQKRAAEEAARALEAGTITQADYARLAAQVVTTEKSLEGLKEQASGASNSLNDAGDNAKKAGDEVKKSGDNANDSSENWEKFGEVAKKACEVAAAAIAAVSAAVVAAGAALVDCTVDAAAFADEVLTASSITSLSTDRVQELQYASELLDVSFDTVSGALGKITKNMESAASSEEAYIARQTELDEALAAGEITIDEYNEQLGEVGTAYGRLGVDVLDANGNLRDSEDVFWDAIEALGNVANETERDALAMEIFGKSARDLNPLIEAGRDNFEGLAEQAHDVGYVMSGDTLDAFGEFDDALQQLNTGTTAAKNALGTVLLPVLTDLANEGVSLLGEFSNGILNTNGDVEAMGDVIEAMIPQVLELLNTYLPMVVELGGSIIETLALSLLDNLGQILEVAISLVETVGTGIIDHLSELAPVIAELVVGLANFIISNLPTIISAALDIIFAIVEGISNNLDELIPAAVSAVLTICEGLLDHYDDLVSASLQLLLGVAAGIVESIPEIVAEIPGLIAALLGALGELTNELPSLARTWGTDLIENFKNSIVNAIPNLISGLTQVADTVTDYLGFSVPEKGPLSTFDKSGSDMIDLFVKSMDSEKYALQKALVQTGDIIYNGMTTDYSGALGEISSSLGALGAAGAGTYVINVNVGTQRLAQAVISAQQMEAYRTGGI